MTNVVDQSAWRNPLLTSAIFTWLGGTATKTRDIYNLIPRTLLPFPSGWRCKFQYNGKTP